MIDHTASIWLVGCSWLSTSTGRQFWLRSLVLVQSSIIENDWVYLHTPKWLSWLVIFADNDGSGLVRIRLRLSIHFSFLLGSFAYAAVHQRAEPDRKFSTFIMDWNGLVLYLSLIGGRVLLRGFCLIYWMWKIGLKNGCKEAYFFSTC